MKMKTNKSSVLNYSLLGIIFGTIIPILDYIPGGHYESFWFFGFASGSFGIWGIIALCIIAKENPPKETAKRIFIFLFMMSLSYYLVEGTRDTVTSYFTVRSLDEETKKLFENEGPLDWICYDYFNFIKWSILSVFCSIYAYITALLRKKKPLFIIACIPPLLIIVAEGLYYFHQLIAFGYAFVPTIINISGFFFCLYILFFKNNHLDKTL